MSDAAPPVWIRRLTKAGSGLDASHKFLLSALWAWAPYRRGADKDMPEVDDELEPGKPIIVYPCRETIAYETGQAIGTVKSQLAKLKATGWIRRLTKNDSRMVLAWREPGAFGDLGRPTEQPTQAPSLNMSTMQADNDNDTTIATTQPDPLSWLFDGREIRAFNDGPEPEIIVADIYDLFGYASASAATRSLRPQHKGVRTWQTLGGPQSLSTVNQGGIARLLMRAQTKRRGMDDAAAAKLREHLESFQDFVTDRMIPDAYGWSSTAANQVPVANMPATMPSHAEALRAWASALDDAERTKAQLALAEQTITTQAAEVERKTETISVLAPAAADWSAHVDRGGTYSVADAAASLSNDPDIDIGRDGLFDWLDTEGWTYHQKDEAGRLRRVPKRTAISAGRLTIKTGKGWRHPHTGAAQPGSPSVRFTPKGIADAGRIMRERLAEKRPIRLALIAADDDGVRGDRRRT
jgi:phage antirepressor YoqD-like protein